MEAMSAFFNITPYVILGFGGTFAVGGILVSWKK